jgi:hypothetical protein
MVTNHQDNFGELIPLPSWFWYSQCNKKKKRKKIWFIIELIGMNKSKEMTATKLFIF